MTQLGLAGGEFLSAEQAELLVADEHTHVIVLAGTQGSGKTSLIASIYQQFHSGPFAGYEFVASRTLMGFENRAHLMRTASKSPTAGADRTSLLETNRFLHLRLSKQGRARTLLLADWAGETYRRVIESREAAAELDVLKACDHLAILIDGERLIDLADRHKARVAANSLLRSCLDADVMKDDINVAIVFSKWDLVHKRSGNTKAAEYSRTVENEFSKLFGPRVGTLSFHRTAAVTVSQDSTIKDGHGLSELLDYWMEQDLRIDHLTVPKVPEEPIEGSDAPEESS